MKHRITAFALCLVMLVFTLAGCVNHENSVKRATAYVYTPAGKLIVYGDCDGYFINDGFVKVTINGISYKTHLSNVTIVETKE